MSEEIGATHGEQLLEAARRDNTELLSQIKAELNNDSEQLAQLINSTKEPITNNSSLHLSCSRGNWDFIDIVLDIEGVEIDPKNRDGQTPLHLAVKYASEEKQHGYFIIDNLIDAGSDPRIIDNFKLKPINYVTDDDQLKRLLESAEYSIALENQIVDVSNEPDDDDEPSDSDSD